MLSRDSLRELMADATLVIAHGGAGTAMDALRASCALLVVANDSLMHSHQVHQINVSRYLTTTDHTTKTEKQPNFTRASWQNNLLPMV